jgi:non-ribosomal peptide synthetase component E (peptide arylation enzyme)
MRVRVPDSGDVEVPTGDEGDIVKSAPTICAGYYRNPGKNREN